MITQRAIQLAEGAGPEMYLRHARKEHTCRTRTGEGCPPRRVRDWDHGPVPSDHTNTIAAGAYYVEYLGESSPYASGVRYCLGCARAAGIVNVAEG